MKIYKLYEIYNEIVRHLVLSFKKKAIYLPFIIIIYYSTNDIKFNR